MDAIGITENVAEHPIDNWDTAVFVEHIHVAGVCASDGETHLLVARRRHTNFSGRREDVIIPARILGHVADIVRGMDVSVGEWCKKDAVQLVHFGVESGKRGIRIVQCNTRSLIAVVFAASRISAIYYGTKVDAGSAEVMLEPDDAARSRDER